MEQFLMVGEELINMRDIHRIKKDITAHVHSIMHIQFSDKVGRNAEFNIIIKELKERKNIIEVRGGSVEEEDLYA